MKKYLSFDIDGIINNYPNCFLDYFNSQKTNLPKVNNINYLKNNHKELYKFFKHEYRLSDYKYNVPVNQIVRELINKLSNSYGIVILTTRPFEEYEGMYSRTYNWLRSSGIKFDFLDIKCINSFNKYSPIVHVDDDLNHVSDLIIKFPFTKFVIKGEGIKDVYCFKNIEDLPLIYEKILLNV